VHRPIKTFGLNFCLLVGLGTETHPDHFPTIPLCVQMYYMTIWSDSMALYSTAEQYDCSTIYGCE